MEENPASESGKKPSLEDLSKEELIKRCKGLLVLAQKAKLAKDSLQEENDTLKNKLNDGATSEIIENLTQQKLAHVTAIEELKHKLRVCEERNNALDSENVSFKRQIKRLTDENEQLITHLEDLEKQLEECKRLGLEQQNQLLFLEENNRSLADTNQKLQDQNSVSQEELQKMLSVSLGEVKKLQSEKKEQDDASKKLKEKLKLYHSKIVKLAGNIKIIKENKREILRLFKTYTVQVEEWKTQLNLASQKLIKQIEGITVENTLFQNENQRLKEENLKFMKQLEMQKTDGEIELLNKDYMNQIDALTTEKDAINAKLAELTEKHREELQVFDDQSKKDHLEIRNRIEENEKIAIEYRKVISKLEEDLAVNQREMEEMRLKNCALQHEMDHLQANEKEFVDKTSEEIFKLVQENAKLAQQLQQTSDRAENQTQTEDVSSSELEEQVTSLKRENSELLKEMNEMNQALKERGETISKFQSHCEEVMKKLQVYETQANKNVDSISQKEEMIKKLEEEVATLKNQEIGELKSEIEALKEKLNANLDSSYAESETMSTSTISRSDEASRLKDLEGSWEERYGKLRNLAIKLKSKVRELSAELSKEQNEKNDLQQKCASNIKTISSLQSHCDKLEDELETAKKQSKDYLTNLETVTVELGKNRQKLAETEDVTNTLAKEIDELKQEKAGTEAWKKQIGAKVQTFRKEVEASKLLKKEYEAKIAKLSAELEAKEQALREESDCHKQTRNSLEHSNIERKKTSVLNLEMQDYERSVKELSQKLESKEDQISKLRSQLESQKSTSNAVREQNKLLEERSEEMKSEISSYQAEITTLKKQVSELEDVIAKKEQKIQNSTQLIETMRSENEELSTELSKVIAEHQKLCSNLKSEKEHLRSQILGLQQTLRETQDTLKLKEDELKTIQTDYDNYKVRAQSVLRQNQSRDVGLEEKLAEELSTVKSRCEGLSSELQECKDVIGALKQETEILAQEKAGLNEKLQEATSEAEDLKSLYDQLSNKHQQTIIEHSETVRSLKVHAETLGQCYRQQLSEQEVRHNREIIELQSKIEKAPSPTELALPPLLTMHREEGEGSESTENTKTLHPVPLERLLGSDSEEVAFIKKQLSEEEAKVIHLTALLADTEQDLAKHAQMNKLLKEEIRRQQRSVEREKHAENLEYLKNVVFKFVTLHNGDERSRLVPVLNTILKLSPEETQKLNIVARGDPGIRGWTNYLPSWSPKS